MVVTPSASALHFFSFFVGQRDQTSPIFFLFIYLFIYLFIFIQLQLSAFSPHPSTPPQPVPPPSPTSTYFLSPTSCTARNYSPPGFKTSLSQSYTILLYCRHLKERRVREGDFCSLLVPPSSDLCLSTFFD